MRLESLPFLFGLLTGALGLALMLDALIPTGTFASRERRSRQRPERKKHGELMIGAGVFLIGLALMAGDSWRYTTLAILAALILFATGVALNYKYLRGLMFGPVAGGRLKRRESDRQRRKLRTR